MPEHQSSPTGPAGALLHGDLRVVAILLSPAALCLGLLAGDHLLAATGAAALSLVAVRLARTLDAASGAIRLAAAELAGAVGLIVVGALLGLPGVALAGLALAEANLAVVLALAPRALERSAGS